MGSVFNIIDHIHSVEAGNQRWYHQNNRDGGHALHDGIHVVGDDGGKSIHRSGKDIAVNVHREVCLF